MRGILFVLLLHFSGLLSAQHDHLVVQQGHTDEILFVSVDPKGKTYATASRDKTVKVWDLRSGKLIKTVTGFSFYVTKVGYSPEGGFLYMRGDLGTCKVFSTGNFEEVTTKFYDDFFPITQLNFGVNDDMLLFGIKGSAFIVNTKSWNKHLLSGRVAGEVDHIVFDPGTKKVTVRAKGGNPTDIDVASILGKENFSIDRKPSEFYPYTAEVNSTIVTIKDASGSVIAIRKQPRVSIPSNAVFSPDNQSLAICFESSNNVLIFSISHNSVQRIPTKFAEVRAVVFSPEGKRILIGDGAQMISCNADGSDRKILYEHNAAITCADISKDNKLLLSGSMDGSLSLYDLVQGKLLSSVKAGDVVSSLSIHPKGKLAAVAEDGHVTVFKLPALKEDKVVIKGTATRSTDFSGDGKFLVAQDAKTKRVMLYETGKEEPAKSFRDPSEHKTRIEAAIRKQLFPVAFSNTGKFLISMGEEWVMHLRVQPDYSVSELKGHSSWANSFHFSSDDKLLVSTSDDGSVRLWDTDKKQNIATMVFNDKDFVVANSENYYFTSKGGYDLVGFYKGGNVFPFEQFDLVLNRPDKVLSTLGSKNVALIAALEKTWMKRIEKSGLQKVEAGGNPPVVSILNRDKIGIQTKTKDLKLSLRATSQGAAIDRILIWINEVPVFGKNGISLRKKGLTDHTQDIIIPLAAGSNAIDVAVMNDKGIESGRERVITDFSDNSKPTLYFAGLGISEFAQSEFNLKYPTKDVSDFEVLVKSLKGSVFADVQSKVFTNEKVTGSAIGDIRSFFRKAGRNDMVILFFAGHGVLDAGFNYYLSSYDMDFASPAAKGLSYESLEFLLDSIAPLKKLFLIDACHSGEVEKDEMILASTSTVEKNGDVGFRAVGNGFVRKDAMGLRSSSELLKEIFADVRRGTGATIISSAGGAEFAMESSEWKNGLFSYCLLNGLKNHEADADDNGKVQVSELLNYVMNAVRELSSGRQSPTTRAENVSLDFELW